MIGKFDLLGDPIPENHGGPGRPAHIATSDNVKKVIDLLTSGVPLKEIARQLGISVPTLKTHYFSTRRIKYEDARKAALAETKAWTVMKLRQAADSGNVSAIKELRRIAEEEERDILEEELRSGDTKPAQAAASPKPGKKELSHEEAMRAEAEMEELLGGDLGRPN